MSKRKFTVEVDSLDDDASVVRVMNEALAPLRRACGLRAIVEEGPGRHVYKCGEAYSYGGVTSICTLPLGHEGDEHETRCKGGELVSSWRGALPAKVLPAADRDDALEACVFQLDDVCKWLATRGYAVAADLLHENRNEFLLAPRLHAEPERGGIEIPPPDTRAVVHAIVTDVAYAAIRERDELRVEIEGFRQRSETAVRSGDRVCHAGAVCTVIYVDGERVDVRHPNGAMTREPLETLVRVTDEKDEEKP